jgi:uncharacterized protein (DUF58 family)
MSKSHGGLALGAVALTAAVASGSRALGVVGVGFLLASGLTWLWTWFAESPASVACSISPAPATEGQRVRVAIEVRRASKLLLGSMTVRATLGRLGPRSSSLRSHGRVAYGAFDLERMPRGVYPIRDTEITLGDLLGLVAVSPPVTCHPVTVVVRPRLVELDGLFSDAGRVGGDGRRLLLRRAAGFDFHSVREYEQGESLRRVHWPTSARRGQLMVKELEDTAHDGVVVVLDCDPAGAVGGSPGSSFDVAVCAAGSILRAHATRGRLVTFASTGRGRPVVPVRSVASDLEGALDGLAAAEPDAPSGLARFLGGMQPSLASAGELVLVTATCDPAAFTAALALAGRRAVSLVWIDAASFAERPTRVEPGVLRLAAHGIPTAVVRRGDELASVLSARAFEAVARG